MSHRSIISTCYEENKIAAENDKAQFCIIRDDNLNSKLICVFVMCTHN